MAVHVMTDKELTKQLPCTYPGCPDEVIVNKFFTPAKARCPLHAGKATQAVRQLVIDPSKQPGYEAAPVVPNKSLMALCCPICEQPMELMKIDEEMGWPTFRCPSPCMTAVVIEHEWGAMVARSIPEPLREIVEAFNASQKGKIDVERRAAALERWKQDRGWKGELKVS